MASELTPSVLRPPAGRLQAHDSLSRQNRIGVALMLLLGLVNVPGVFMPTPGEEEGPPFAVLLVGSIGGLVVLVAGWRAWRTGCRRALRLAAGVLILLALSSVPAFFVDVPAAVKVLVALSVVVTFVGIVLALAPGRRSAAVLD